MNDVHIEKPGKGVFLLQKKVLERKIMKPKKQYSLAVEPPQMIQANPLQRRHTLNMSQSIEHDLMSMNTDEEFKE
jgi:hypothetical protein